jgi:hypothetical protein
MHGTHKIVARAGVVARVLGQLALLGQQLPRLPGFRLRVRHAHVPGNRFVPLERAGTQMSGHTLRRQRVWEVSGGINARGAALCSSFRTGLRCRAGCGRAVAERAFQTRALILEHMHTSQNLTTRAPCGNVCEVRSDRYMNDRYIIITMIIILCINPY